MSDLSPAARALLDAARGHADDPPAEAVARVYDAVRARLAAADLASDAPHAPPPNTTVALARAALARIAGALAVVVAVGPGAPAPAPRPAGGPSRDRVAVARAVSPRARPPAAAAVAEPSRPLVAVAAVDPARVAAPSRAEPHRARARARRGEPLAQRSARTAVPPVALARRAPREELAGPVGLALVAHPAFADAPSAQRAPRRDAALARQAMAPRAGDGVDSAPPSDALANALRLYERERYAEAAVQLQRVAQGTTGDSVAGVQRAQFFLAKSLFHLGLHVASLGVFDEIVERGAEHAYFAQTLPWLAQLAVVLPEPAAVARRVGRYDAAYLRALDAPDTRDVLDELLYLLGRARYDEAQLDEAIALLGRVRRGARRYVASRLLAGVAHVRQHRARPAADAFREVILALQEGVANVPDRERMEDLAWIELARLYYAARHYPSAIEAYGRVRASSDQWLDAHFESAWAFFLHGDDAQALGHIHSLEAPQFEHAYYPEALVLRAVILHARCRLDDADAAIARFHQRWGGLRPALEQYLASRGDAAANVQLLREVRDEGASVPRALRPILRAALGDRAVARDLEYLAWLDAEAARLEALPAALRASELGERVRSDLALGRSFALDDAGDRVRARCRRAIDELADLERQATALSIEILSSRRGDIEQEIQGARRPALPDRPTTIVAVDELEEGFEWPFTGEYWPDEVGTYRVRTQDRCGR